MFIINNLIKLFLDPLYHICAARSRLQRFLDVWPIAYDLPTYLVDLQRAASATPLNKYTRLLT